MGRKTYESFGGKPLPQRHNIVVTRDAGYDAGEATIATSIEQAIEKAGQVEEVMIIGGASFYEQTLPVADRMYLTEVDATVNGDAWFPEFEAENWRLVETHSHPADDKNSYPVTFKVYDRKRA